MRIAETSVLSWHTTNPWGNIFGLARTIIALSIAGTLFFSPSSAVFVQVVAGENAYVCSGRRVISMYCLFPKEHLWTLQILAGILLLVIATGWRPAITSIPLAYLVTSYTWSTVIPDGGDQLASILSILLIPVGLTDNRKWHWQVPANIVKFPGQVRLSIAVITMILIKMQISIVYLTSSIGKLGNTEWVNGTAIYYWFRQPNFGIPQYLAIPMDWLGTQQLFVAAVTWGTLLLEFSIGVGILLPMAVRIRILLPAAFVFHMGIFIFMGISSFAVVMIAAIILLLCPNGSSVRLISNRISNKTSEEESHSKIGIDQ